MLSCFAQAKGVLWNHLQGALRGGAHRPSFVQTMLPQKATAAATRGGGRRGG